MKRIILTGGMWLCRHFTNKSITKNGYKVKVFDTQWFGNYLSKDKHLEVVKKDIKEIFEKDLEGYDCLIHLANIANDPAVELNPTLSWDVNVLASQQLIEKSISSGFKAFYLCKLWKCLWNKR